MLLLTLRNGNVGTGTLSPIGSAVVTRWIGTVESVITDMNVVQNEDTANAINACSRLLWSKRDGDAEGVDLAMGDLATIAQRYEVRMLDLIECTMQVILTFFPEN